MIQTAVIVGKVFCSAMNNFIDCSKCYHKPVCNIDTDRRNYFGECPHYQPEENIEMVSRCKNCDEYIEDGGYCKIHSTKWNKFYVSKTDYCSKPWEGEIHQ